jgi:hypothetical protein
MSYQIEVNQRIYTVVDDLTDRFEVLLAGRVLSAVWNEPLPGFQIEVDHPDVFVNVMADGYFALAGKIGLLFPDLATQAYALQLTVDAPFHTGSTATVPVPPGSTFPLPQQLFLLHYRLVRLQGRITLAADGSPVIGAAVTINEPNLATLRSPTQFPHLAGTPIRSGSLNPAGGPRTITLAALRGEQLVMLNDTTGLAAGSIVRLGNPETYLFVVVDSVGPVPNQVHLRGLLTRSVAAGEVAQPVTFAPDGGSQPLATDLPAGLGLLLLGGNLGGNALLIDDATPTQVEYFAAGAIADSAGYYRLDGIGRVQSINLQAVNPPTTHDIERIWFIDNRRSVNTVNLALTLI